MYGSRSACSTSRLGRSRSNQDGCERDYAHVAELATPDGWGEGMRLIVRRELAHAGAPMRLLDHEGNRYPVLITSLDETDIAYISAMIQRPRPRRADHQRAQALRPRRAPGLHSSL